MAVRRSLPRAFLVALAGAAVVLLGLIAPPAASAMAPDAVKKYQVCWWQVDQPDDSFECFHNYFTGATAVVDVPTGNCWSNNQQGGTVQIKLNGGWTDVPGLGVQYEEGLYCTDPSVPYVSFVRLPVKTKKFSTMQLRFLIPFNDTIDTSVTTVVCVRWSKNSRFCQD